MSSSRRMHSAAAHGLIPGLPDDVVLSCILSRLSWKCFPSLLRVCTAWRAAFTSGLIATIRTLSPDFQEHLLALIHFSRRTKSHPQCSSFLDISLAVSVYDPILCVWEELPPIPFIPHGAPMFARCVCVDGSLFILGGCSPQNWQPVEEVYRMDLARGLRQWQKCARMNTPRLNFACIFLEGKIIVAGGHGRDSLILATAELYDVQKDAWTPLPDLNTPRTECLGAVFNNQICILGGYTLSLSDHSPAMADPVNCISSMEFLDKHSTQWTSGTSTLVPIKSLRAASGQLCPLTDNFYSDTSGDVSKDGMLISNFGKEDDNAEAYPALTAFSVNQDLYAFTRDNLGYYGSGVSFCRGKKSNVGSGGRGVVRWQQIECPFEAVELAPSCCTVSV